MQIIDNDIFSCTEDIIVHQINCQGVMGHGIAKQVKDMFYEVYEAYKLHCDVNDKKDLLGTVLYVDIGDKIIANIWSVLLWKRLTNRL